MKIFKVLTLISLISLVFSLAGAQIPPPEQAGLPDIPTTFFGCSPTDTLRTCLLRILGQVLRIILVLALVAAAFFVAWAGFLYVYSGKPDEAKTRMIAAAAGLVIAFLAWVGTFLFTRFIGQGQI